MKKIFIISLMAYVSFFAISGDGFCPYNGEATCDGTCETVNTGLQSVCAQLSSSLRRAEIDMELSWQFYDYSAYVQHSYAAAGYAQGLSNYGCI